MATVRAYTTIEQSRKLAEILPLESADMWYSIVDNEAFVCLEQHNEYEQIPCWSIAALLDVLPDDCGIDKENGKYVASYLISNECCTYTSDNPVDACVAMVEKLHELKML